MPNNTRNVVEIYSDVEVRNSPLRSRAINEQAVYNSLDNIFTIDREERLFRFSGFNFEDLLFKLLVTDEHDVDSVVFQTQTSIIREVARDPRIIMGVNDIHITTDVINRTVEIFLTFRIDGLGDQSFTRSFNYTAVAEPWRP